MEALIAKIMEEAQELAEPGASLIEKLADLKEAIACLEAHCDAEEQVAKQVAKKPQQKGSFMDRTMLVWTNE